MADLRAIIAAEEAYVEKALADIDGALGRDNIGTIELAAIGSFLHNMYSGMENILKRLLKARDIALPEGATWHKNLIGCAVDAGILPQNVADDLFEYLGFRHMFIHGYCFMLEAEHLLPLARKARPAWNRFTEAIEQGAIEEDGQENE